MNISILVFSLIATGLLLYMVRSLRTIGSKISQLQSHQKKSSSEISQMFGDQRELVKRSTQLQLLPLIEKGSPSWKFIVSLTSHSPRFESLEEVLVGLKLQVLQPEEIILNIAREDVANLPKNVKELAASEFITIVETDDFGPAKKLIPTLQTVKELPIIVIDDDLTYDPELFLHLMSAHYLYPKAIIAARVHQITTNVSGDLNRFDQWNKQYIDCDGPASDLMPTSGAGTLYPVGSLHPDAVNADLYRDLSPYTDDLWWYFQGRRNGTLVRRISGFSDLNFIEDSQAAGLWKNGNQDRNESNLLNLVQKYGNPLAM